MLVAGAGSLLFIGPVAAAVVAGAAALGAWAPRSRRLLRLAPAAVYGLAATYIVGRQAVSRPSAAFEWPAEQATAHQPALVAVALLLVVVALDDRPGRSP